MIQPLRNQYSEIYKALLFDVVSKDDVCMSTSKLRGAVLVGLLNPRTSDSATTPVSMSIHIFHNGIVKRLTTLDYVIISKLDSEYPQVHGAEWDPFGD